MYSERVSNNDSYSEYIYYCASADEVKRFQSSSTSEISGFAESLKVEHEKTHDAQRAIMEGIKMMHMKNPPGYIELKQELDQLRKERGNPHYDDLKKEVTQLKALVEQLVTQLKPDTPAT